MDKELQRFIKLGWSLIEAKIMYYENPIDLQGKGLEITDAEYDAMEHEYLKLCVKLGKKNTISHDNYAMYGLEAGMMEVDWNRPSCSSALKRLYHKAGIPDMFRELGTWHAPTPKKKKSSRKKK